MEDLLVLGDAVVRTTVIDHRVLADPNASWGEKGFEILVAGIGIVPVVGDGLQIGAKALWTTQRAAQLGLAGESAVRATYVIGNKVTVAMRNGPRVPDGLVPGVSISEVKNVRYLHYSTQLKDYVHFAQENGLRFDLFVRSTTVLSAPLKNARDAGLLTVRSIPLF